MDAQLSLLIQLQEIDAKIRTLEEQRKRLPGVLAELDQKRAASKADLEKVKEGLQTAQKNKRDRDKDLEAGAQKVEKLKGRTSEIKTNKEYTALLKEIETAEQENKVIEDDILKLMEKIDAAAGEIRTAESGSAQEAAAIEAERKQIEESMAKLDAALAGDEQVRADIAARVDRTLLSQYEKRYTSLNGKVVVEARGEACSGCFMSIPPQIFVNVKKNADIITCPHCHRILYYKEAITPKAP